jgi:hypothetical protein
MDSSYSKACALWWVAHLIAVPDNTPNNATILGVPSLEADGKIPRYAPKGNVRETAAGFPAPTWSAGDPPQAVRSSGASSSVASSSVASRERSTGPAQQDVNPTAPRPPAKPHHREERTSALGSSLPAGYSSAAPVSSGPPAATNWPELYEQLGSAEKRRALREMQRKADQEALAEYERWSKRTVAAVMEDMARAAQTRAAELLEATGKQLEVEYPSGPTVVGAAGDAEIRFLRMSLGKACVHVYSSHARGSTTHIHLLPAFTDSLKKNHRLVSEPGAFVVRRPDDQYELRYLRGDPYAGNAEVMTMDMLLFKALRLLVRCTEDE